MTADSVLSFSAAWRAIMPAPPGLVIIAAAAGYLLGSIPFGLIFTRLGGYGDVRCVGSGNTGATNVLRAGGRKLAALTLLCDAGKGAAAALIFTIISYNLGALAGFCAFLGHIFPVWLKFKGGKGVAAYLGVLLALQWQTALLFAAVWLVCAFLFRYSSLAALCAAACAACAGFFMMPGFAACLSALMGILIFIRHRGNIARLTQGAESRIGSKK